MKEQALVIGSGAREHALGWKLRQSPQVGQIFFAPGNAGTATFSSSENLPINVDETDKLVDFASKNRVDLTVVGPEGPLVAGIADIFEARELRIFGPRQKAARLEGDKGFSAQFMRDNDIPQPDFELSSSLEGALRFIQKPKWDKFVVKATGLASGKGVILPDSRDEAEDAVRRILIDREFGESQHILFQERLYGREVSLISVTDGKNIVPLLPARDYKRIGGGDIGPNTGGMGSIVDRQLLTEQELWEAREKILEPTIRGLRNQGIIFRGALYAGLMITDDGLKVIEYNVRFGDPETQPQMFMMESDLFQILKDCADGKLQIEGLEFDNGVAISVVLASEGYPQNPKTGDVINGLSAVGREVAVFHAGTLRRDQEVVTGGGRVLSVVTRGDTIEGARKKAYGAIGSGGINFRGMQYREDIGR